jgi:hypothetical protein
MKIYIEPRDYWVGYYRGETHHYVCLLPCLVIRWRRRVATPDPAGWLILDLSEQESKDFIAAITECSCDWWTPEQGPGAGVPQRQLNRANDCPVAGHNTALPIHPDDAASPNRISENPW